MKKQKQTAHRALQGRLRLSRPPYGYLSLLLIACFLPALAQAVETVCARFKPSRSHCRDSGYVTIENPKCQVAQQAQPDLQG